MSTHVVLNLLNKLGEKIKCEACRAFHLFFATSLINSNYTGARLLDYIYLMTMMTLNLLKIYNTKHLFNGASLVDR